MKFNLYHLPAGCSASYISLVGQFDHRDDALDNIFESFEEPLKDLFFYTLVSSDGKTSGQIHGFIIT